MKIKLVLLPALSFGLHGCIDMKPPTPVVPAKVYSDQLKRQASVAPGAFQSDADRARTLSGLKNQDGRARLHLVSEDSVPDSVGSSRHVAPSFSAGDGADRVTNDDGYVSIPNSAPDTRDYNGPLALGDPGVNASLWRESGTSGLFRDFRAWQPMDLITIVVSENAEGKKEADTEVKQKSTVSAAIESFFGLENYVAGKNDGDNVKLDPSALISASAQNDFKGEGETNRKDSLKATITAVVVEILPSGILRIEGQKIIAVNNEEQTMVLSGLVRTRDINSENEINSAKIANMRIDYFGRGTIGEAQYGGWVARLLRMLWPF